MIRPTRTWRVAAVFAAATLVLTACGSDSDSGSDKKSDSSSKSAAKGDGTLTIGTLLPQTGDLAFLGPPEFAGVQAAVDEINAAGGVEGKEIVKIDSDSGDGTPDIAGASVDKLLAQNADVIVGAASSNVSKSVIDKITGAGVVQFSPANTAAGFDEYPDKGLYFRTAPSDVLQGKVVANLAVQDGVAAANILYRPLLERSVTLADLGAVQRRRELPMHVIQRLQVVVQNRIIGPTLGSRTKPTPPWMLRLFARLPFLRRIPARLIGLGFRPEHIRTPEAAKGAPTPVP